MSAVFLKIVNMSITASWLIIAAVVLRFLLKKAPKWISCLLWALVALRLVCPFTFESVLSLVPNKEPIPVNIVMLQKPTVEIGIPTIDTPVNAVISENFTPAPSDSANPLQIIVPVLAAVWIAGIVILLVYALISYMRLRKTVSASFELQKGVKACDDVKAPFILGIIRPVVYVPSSMEGDTLDYVLKHEKAHLARHDHWWKPFGFLLLTVYWFNPLCWLAYILLCRDIESACDEKVIRDMDKSSVAAYSQALLDCSFSRRAIAACPLAFGEVGVKERIKGVLNYKKPAFWVIAVALIACIVVSVCFLTSPKDDAQDLSLLNYKNAISLVIDSDGIDAVYHGTYDDGITFTQLTAPDQKVNCENLARYLDNASWKKQRAPSDIPASSNSIEFLIDDNYTITVYENPQMAKVTCNGEERYYITGPSYYSMAFELFCPSVPVTEPTTFTATITGVTDDEIYISPEEGSEELKSSLIFSIPLKYATDFEPGFGDTIEVCYNGYINAISPSTLGEIYYVSLISKAKEYTGIWSKVTYVGWNDELVVWDDALNKDTIILSSAFHLPVYKLESVEDLKTFEKKFENTMEFGVWHDNSIAPFDVLALDYTEKFFEDSAIIITYMSAGSGSFRYDVRDVSFDNSTLCVNVVQTYNPDIYTDDMAGWLLVTRVPKSVLAGIEKYDAIFAGIAEDVDASVPQTPAGELPDLENETVISTFVDYDLTHDGIPDIVQVSYDVPEGFNGTFTEQTFHNNSIGFVKVHDPLSSNSAPIFEGDFSRAHVGNAQYFITTVDGKDYLVISSLWAGQGFCDYYYSVNFFEKGERHTIDTQSVDFEYGTKHAADEFFESLYKWINDDSLLLMAADIDLDFTFYSTEDNIVNPNEYYHRKISQY